MNRALFITVHMYLSAFFAAAIFLVAISGGLYLIGIKGSIEETPVFSSADYAFDRDADDLKGEVDALLAAAGVSDYSYEYVKDKGSTLLTRPTTREHYIVKLGDEIELVHAAPSLQKSMIELHMGHGPGVFKTFQQFFALGMLLIVASGLLLGLTSAKLMPRTLAASGVGAVIFFLLALA